MLYCEYGCVNVDVTLSFFLMLYPSVMINTDDRSLEAMRYVANPWSGLGKLITLAIFANVQVILLQRIGNTRDQHLGNRKRIVAYSHTNIRLGIFSATTEEADQFNTKVFRYLPASAILNA